MAASSSSVPPQAMSPVGASAGGTGATKGIGEWLWGAYHFATDQNDFRRNLIVNLGLFAAGVWLARNLNDIDLTAPQPGL